MESQDSGFGYARASEIDIKEHRIDQTEGVPTVLGLRLPGQAGTAGPPPKSVGGDPKLRQVYVASPASLYGTAETPMPDPQNIQGCSDSYLF